MLDMTQAYREQRDGEFEWASKYAWTPLLHSQQYYHHVADSRQVLFLLDSMLLLPCSQPGL